MTVFKRLNLIHNPADFSPSFLVAPLSHVRIPGVGDARDEIVNTLAGDSHSRNNRNSEKFLHLVHIYRNPLMLGVIPNIERNDKRHVFFQKMQRQVKIPLQIGCVNNIDDYVSIPEHIRSYLFRLTSRFQTVRSADHFQEGKDFQITIDLQEFQLDPSLAQLKDRLPTTPFHFVVETIWFHTLDKQAGLELAEVELTAPTDDDSE